METLRACDIIISSSQGRGVAICYVSPVLTPWKSLGYTKHTCTLARFHIMASYMHLGLHQNWGNFTAYHKFDRSPDTLNTSALFALLDQLQYVVP